MSGNHQQMPSKKYLEKVERLQKLKHGDIEAMRQAENNAQKSLERMERRSLEMQKGISEARQKHLNKLYAIENRTIGVLNDVNKSAEEIHASIQDLQEHLKEATNDIEEALSALKQTSESTASMYMQAKNEFLLCQLDSNYMRFEPDEMNSIQIKLRNLENTELSGAAKQAQLETILNDIFLMDIQVSAKRMAFIKDDSEALRLAETLTTQAKNIRENNYEDIDNKSGRLLDIDFWTDGCFSVMEKEVEEIRKRLLDGQTDSHYTHKQLQKDLKRLRELEGIQDFLLNDARAKYNLSQHREAQGEFIEQILSDDHRYSLIDKGFAKKDEREAYIVRMYRHTDEAQIEVIINPGNKNGENDVYFRVDSTTYMDEKTMASITQAIADELHENGIEMSQYRGCQAEYLPQFKQGDSLDISSEARGFHGIGERKPLQMPG